MPSVVMRGSYNNNPELDYRRYVAVFAAPIRMAVAAAQDRGRFFRTHEQSGLGSNSSRPEEARIRL